MNRKEWTLACVRNWDSVDHTWDYKSRAIQKSLVYNSNPEATTRHHLMNTPEQIAYNSEHYEMWGFNLDGTFEYGKYIVFVTDSEHLEIHTSCEDTNKKRSKSLIGHPVSCETRKKLSEATKRSMTDEHRKLLSNIAKNNMTDERRAIISAATKEAMRSTEIRSKISNSKLGKHLSDEHKKAISEGGKGREVSLETREKISKIHKGKYVSNETRKKLSEANKKAWENEEYRQYMSTVHCGKTPWNKGVKMSDDQKEKLNGPFTDSHKESLKRSMKMRRDAYYKLKESDNDLTWREFLKNIWPNIKDGCNEQ